MQTGRRRALPGWLGAVLLTVLAWSAAAPTAQGQRGNLRLGGMYVNLQAYFEAEYNDNINYSNANRQSDIILRPGIQLGTTYPLTQLNTLSFDLGVSFQQYLFHSSLSSYNTFADISPNSQLAYTIKVNNFTIKLYDSFSYSVQPNNAIGYNQSSGNFVYQISQYARFTNQVGVNVDWNLNKLILYGGAYRYDVFPQSNIFDIQRRWQYTGLFGGRLIVSPSVTVGLGATYTANYYQENFNNNSGSWYVGPTIVWQPNSTWTLNASGGYIFYSFQDTGTNGDTSQPSTLVGELTVTQQLNSEVSHSLTFSRTSSFGYVSNTLDVNRVAYSLQWLIHSQWTFNFWAYYETGLASGGNTSASIGSPTSPPQDYHKWSVSPGIQYQLNPNTTLYGNYEYTDNISNIAVQTYNRNRVIVGIRYQF